MGVPAAANQLTGFAARRVRATVRPVRTSVPAMCPYRMNLPRPDDLGRAPVWDLYVAGQAVRASPRLIPHRALAFGVEIAGYEIALPFQLGELTEDDADDIADILHDVATRPRLDGLDVDTRVLWGLGYPHEILGQYLDAEPTDLVVATNARPHRDRPRCPRQRGGPDRPSQSHPRARAACAAARVRPRRRSAGDPGRPGQRRQLFARADHDQDLAGSQPAGGRRVELVAAARVLDRHDHC